MKYPAVCLAPMDGYTDRAYRQIVRKLNSDVILYSEFTSIHGMQYSEKVRERIEFIPEERPYFAQIFGNDPKLFGIVAKQLAEMGVTGVDINMGCPSKKIVHSMHGSGLMKEPEIACNIVEACSKAAPDILITVKTRLGWEDTSQLIPFVKSLENAGASIITIHGRTYKQGFKGTANWEPIYTLKKAVDIPVFGNGDVENKEDGDQKIKNLDGIMIGRAAIGNPWVFWDQEKISTLSLNDKLETMLEHYFLLRQFKEERKAVIEFRKHISGYIHTIPNAKAIRIELMKTKTEQDFVKQVKGLM